MSDQWEAITDAAHQVSKDGGRELAKLVIAADDLIEELEARAEAAEAKLAKAVEAFTRIDDLTCHNMPMTAREEQAVNREVRAALEKLKGQTDE